MNTRGLTRHHLSTLLIACAVVTLLLCACQPVNAVPTTVPSEQPAADAPTGQPLAATQPASDASADIMLDLQGTAREMTIETIAAVPASAGGPFWEAGPQHLRATLQGYLIADHMMKPQIFVYPLADLASANEAAGKTVSDLQALLQTRQAGDQLPFLPLLNMKQVMHPQMQYLDFKNGQGVRFLTQFNQAATPINNIEMIYTFQGLTSDGQYYIAAVLPVTHPELPATQQVDAQQAAEFNDFPAYLTKTITWLDQQPASSFSPDLAKLDALIQSIEVK